MNRRYLIGTAILLSVLMLAVPGRAADNGIPDSLYFILTDVPGGPGPFTVELYVNNDGDSLAGISAGFCWSDAGLVLDSAKFYDEEFELWGDEPYSAHFWYDLTPENTNASRHFYYVGLWLGTSYRLPTPEPQHLATYYFTLTTWQPDQRIVIDTCCWRPGSELLFCGMYHPPANDCYRPRFGGIHENIQTETDDYDTLHILSDTAESTLPIRVSLGQNYPNPFNPSTSIEFTLPRPGRVNLRVFNVLGQKIRTLVYDSYAEGSYRVTWDGLDDNGRQVPSGVYFYRIDSPDFTQTRKMVLMK